jgi:hypothetical protein
MILTPSLPLWGLYPFLIFPVSFPAGSDCSLYRSGTAWVHSSSKDAEGVLKAPIRRIDMKRLAIVALGISVAAIGGMSPPHVHAEGSGVVSYTQNFHHQTDAFASVNPCTGVPGTLTETFNGVVHVTTFADGPYEVTFIETGTISFVPDDSTQPSYSGKLNQSGNQHLTQQTAVGTVTLHFRVLGTDGSIVTQHEVQHLTVTPTGVSVSFDRPQLTCG